MSFPPSVQFSSVAHLCPTLCDPMNRSMPGLPQESHQEALYFLFTFCHKGGVICICEVIDISPGNLDSSLCFFQPRMWSTGEGNDKPLQYSCLENPMNIMKRQNDRILKEELPRSVGAQYATGDH